MWPAPLAPPNCRPTDRHQGGTLLGSRHLGRGVGGLGTVTATASAGYNSMATTVTGQWGA